MTFTLIKNTWLDQMHIVISLFAVEMKEIWRKNSPLLMITCQLENGAQWLIAIFLKEQYNNGSILWKNISQILILVCGLEIIHHMMFGINLSGEILRIQLILLNFLMIICLVLLLFQLWGIMNVFLLMFMNGKQIEN